MGRKSREKKERHIKDRASPLKVYRFFKEKSHAEALCNGDVWLSTIETCRRYEDPLQGDPDEAIQTYNSGFISGGSDDSRFVSAVAHAGIHVGPGCSGITIQNCRSFNKMPDAFVLCTTLEFQPENLNDTFGNYCVEISNVEEFFGLITKKLKGLLPIKLGAMGVVRYGSNSFYGYQPPPGQIGFVKNRDKYSSQKEFRFLWVPETFDIQPGLVNCPELSYCCRMIS